MSKNYQIYFLNILASGLYYSFLTSQVVTSQVSNKLSIIAVSSIANLIIFFDFRNFHFLEKFSVRRINEIGLFIGVSLLTISRYDTSFFFYLLSYFLITIILSFVTIIFEKKILSAEMSLENGFINIQMLRNFSKMIGFFVGVMLSQYSQSLFLYFFIFLMILNTLNVRQVVYEKEEENPKSVSSIEKKYLFLMLGILTSMTTIWIPLLTSDYTTDYLKRVAWLPFVLPGVFIVLFLAIQKKFRILQKNFLIEGVYIGVLLFFLFLRVNHFDIILQTIIFSCLSALSISVSVKLRESFIKANANHRNMKFILQSLYVSTEFFIFLVAIINGFSQGVPIYIIFLSMLSVLCLLIFGRRIYS